MSYSCLSESGKSLNFGESVEKDLGFRKLNPINEIAAVVAKAFKNTLLRLINFICPQDDQRGVRTKRQ